MVRYRDLVETPAAVLDGVCRLPRRPRRRRDLDPAGPGVDLRTAPAAAARQPHTTAPWAHRRLGSIRSARTCGARPAPTAPQRPELTPEERRALIEYFADDIRHLEELLGRSFWDWFSDEGLGTYTRRRTLLTRPTALSRSTGSPAAAQARNPPIRSVAWASPIDCSVAAARLDA